MANEIERKFRVDPQWKPPGDGVPYEQGYLSSHPDRVVRVRIEGKVAKLTVKGKTSGVTRAEFEYPIPIEDAGAMLAICEKPHITKRRHIVIHDGKQWEVDVFGGDNEGLVIAELELSSEAETYARPAWLREEVSDDPRFYNSNLVKSPFKSWGK